MSKNTLMVLALLVTLLSGWLVLSLAQSSQGNAAASAASSVKTSGGSVINPLTSGPSGNEKIQTQVDISEGTKTTVEVK